jgi:putative ABC transport system substrate-binding protein
MATVADPVGAGLVQNLAHPGGNITGFSLMETDLHAKRLELLKEVMPRMKRVAVLGNSANPSFGPTFKQMEVAAKSLNVSLLSFEVRKLDDFGQAFADMAKRRVDALVIQGDTLFGEENAKAIAELAAKQRLLSVGNNGFAEVGGTIGYGRTDAELYRRGAYFVDKILKGAKPGDLPIEQAARFEVVINTRVAKALGIKIPQSVLLRAGRTIE